MRQMVGIACQIKEKNCYQSFLLGFRSGDYVVYINVLKWGECTAAQFTGEHEWRFEGKDFKHRFLVDPETVTVYVFNRNDAAVQ